MLHCNPILTKFSLAHELRLTSFSNNLYRMFRCLCAEWLLAMSSAKWPLNRLVAENRKEAVLYQFSPTFAWSSISRPMQLRESNPMSSWRPTAALYEHGYQIGVPLYRKLRFYVTLHSWTVREIFLLLDIRVVELFSRRKGNFNSNRCIGHTSGEKDYRAADALSHLCISLLCYSLFFSEMEHKSNVILSEIFKNSPSRNFSNKFLWWITLCVNTNN